MTESWPPKKSGYPKTVVVADTVYRVVFARQLGKDTLGLCDGDKKIITIKLGQTREDTLLTFIHELFHCLEFEYGFKINHRTVHKLEKPIAQLLFDNFL